VLLGSDLAFKVSCNELINHHVRRREPVQQWVFGLLGFVPCICWELGGRHLLGSYVGPIPPWESLRISVWVVSPVGSTTSLVHRHRPVQICPLPLLVATIPSVAFVGGTVQGEVSALLVWPLVACGIG
jgi:hypothetical protein